MKVSTPQKTKDSVCFAESFVFYSTAKVVKLFCRNFFRELSFWFISPV